MKGFIELHNIFNFTYLISVKQIIEVYQPDKAENTKIKFQRANEIATYICKESYEEIKQKIAEAVK